MIYGSPTAWLVSLVERGYTLVADSGGCTGVHVNIGSGFSHHLIASLKALTFRQGIGPIMAKGKRGKLADGDFTRELQIAFEWSFLIQDKLPMTMFSVVSCFLAYC